MPYDQYSLGSLTLEIAVAMEDPNMVTWQRTEIEGAIKEGLLYWGALTSYWRERGSFQAQSGVAFYDLSAILPTLRSRSVTLGDLVTQIQYHLDEAANGVSGAGMTEQFTVNQIIKALVRARNQFVLDSRLPFTATNINGALTWNQATQTWDDTGQTWDQLGGVGPFPISAPPAGRSDLSPTVVAIGYAAWIDSRGVVSPLRREDSFSEDALNPGWTLEPGVPFAFSEAETRPVQIQFFPAPAASGALDLIYIASVNLTVADTQSMLVPDEFASAIKYAALYSILSTHNEGFDPQRAKYAKERYAQGVTTAQSHRSVMRVQVQDVPVQLDALSNVYAVFPNWRNARGVPRLAATIYDLVGLAPVPRSAVGVTCDLVRSAPLPTQPDDFIQMGPEEIPYLMDYVRHILSFKLGGDEFIATLQLHDNFLDGAAQRNKLLAVQARYLTPLFGQAAQEEAITNAA